MNNQEIKERLIAVFNAFDAIEVKGFSNINNLAGGMNIIKDIIDDIEDEPPEK